MPCDVGVCGLRVACWLRILLTAESARRRPSASYISGFELLVFRITVSHDTESVCPSLTVSSCKTVFSFAVSNFDMISPVPRESVEPYYRFFDICADGISFHRGYA